MDNLEEILSRIDGAPKDAEHGDLEKWLKSQDSQIGKMQQSISKTSQRYGELKEKRELVEQALKLLRRENSEYNKKSGLVSKGTHVQNMQNDEWYVTHCKRREEYKKVKRGHVRDWDWKAMRRLYREYSIGVENGDADCMYWLGWLTYELSTTRYGFSNTNKDLIRRLFRLSAEKGNPWGMIEVANSCEDLSKEEEFDYFAKAFSLISSFPSEMKRYGISLYQYYYVGWNLDCDAGVETHLGSISTEEIVKWLIPDLFWYPNEEHIEGNYWDPVRARHDLVTRIISKREGEDACVKYAMEYCGCDYVIYHAYEKTTDVCKKQKLEEWIIYQRESNEDPFKRFRIYLWYGKRYEEGIGVRRDKVKAFLSYWEAEKRAELCDEYVYNVHNVTTGNGPYNGPYLQFPRRKRIAMLTNAVDNMDLLAENFLISIGEAGYWDAYKYLGDFYAHMTGLSNYEKAQEYYLKAQNGSMKDECIKACDHMADLIEQAIIYNSAVKLLDTDRYEYGFGELVKLAQKDYPEACMKVAEISENKTSYLAMKLRDSLLGNRDIILFYKKAANAGLPGAIRKMVEIYRDGSLGVMQDVRQSKIWEEKLKKI